MMILLIFLLKIPLSNSDDNFSGEHLAAEAGKTAFRQIPPGIYQQRQDFPPFSQTAIVEKLNCMVEKSSQAAFNSIFNNDFSYINPQYSHFLNHISTVKRGFNRVFNRVSKTVWKLWLFFYSFVTALPLLFQQLYVIMILYYYRRVSFFPGSSPQSAFSTLLRLLLFKTYGTPPAFHHIFKQQK